MRDATGAGSSCLDKASDDALAARAATGERTALEQLLRRNVDRVHAICRRITCHPDDAAAATQQALITICQGITSFESGTKFSTWLYRAATEAALHEAHRHNRGPAADLTQGTDLCPAIDAAMSQLPPEFRAAVVLRDLCGLDYAGIAAILELSTDTVRSRVYRGRQALSTLITSM